MAEHSIVVVGDLHLGVDAAGDPEGAERGQAFAAFVDGLTADRPATTRLVLDGDVLDLTRGEVRGGGLRARVERPDEAAVLARLDALAAAHPDLFAALARFMAAGGRLAVVAGNHDLELAERTIQAAFLARMGDAAIDRVSFHRRSLWLPGVLYAEHGHHLHDISAPGPHDRLPLAIELAALTRAVRQAGTPAVVGAVVAAAASVAAAMRGVASAADATAEPDPGDLPDAVRARLDRLTVGVRPLTFVRVARVAATKPLAVLGPPAVVAAVGAAVAGRLAERRAQALALAAGWLALGAIAIRERRRLWPPARSSAYLADGAARIDALLAHDGCAVPVYVLGHSHVADRRPIGGPDGRLYLNPGAWVAAAEGGSATGYPFVRITVSDGSVDARIDRFVAA